ncbi:unnamed protein product [Didymodactylos carnosus]|uniref:Uncharacterized protein n=1 Tax=Didymodactylos carnosus TaxID=1234261 RepID=A0A815VVX3_9BILA|nr:unnamed protein product [Didymodactylos carnosus]CAF1537226.1 unnamed protein product [Didymodactylos carnosus]CAF3909443.1 unnamed protein product [Didymodactylos carnosus]CAF4397169.1 unnamed protein product [Didymodactylos carnosus]
MASKNELLKSIYAVLNILHCSWDIEMKYVQMLFLKTLLIFLQIHLDNIESIKVCWQLYIEVFPDEKTSADKFIASLVKESMELLESSNTNNYYLAATRTYLATILQLFCMQDSRVDWIKVKHLYHLSSDIAKEMRENGHMILAGQVYKELLSVAISTADGIEDDTFIAGVGTNEAVTWYAAIKDTKNHFQLLLKFGSIERLHRHIEVLFQMTVRCCDLCGFAEYMNYLCNEKRHNIVINEENTLLKNEMFKLYKNKIHELQNSYGKYDLLTVDVHVQHMIKKYAKVTLVTMPYICYIFAQCFIAKGDTENAQIMEKEMNSLLETMMSDLVVQNTVELAEYLHNDIENVF